MHSIAAGCISITGTANGVSLIPSGGLTDLRTKPRRVRISNISHDPSVLPIEQSACPRRNSDLRREFAQMDRIVGDGEGRGGA